MLHHRLLHTDPSLHIDSLPQPPDPTAPQVKRARQARGVPRGPADTDEHPGIPLHSHEAGLPLEWRTERFPCLSQLHRARKCVKEGMLSHAAVPVVHGVLTSQELLDGVLVMLGWGDA